MSAARLSEALSLAADSVGDVAILGDVLEVFGVESEQDVDGGGDGRARVAREVVNDGVVARPPAILRDEAQHFVRDGAHRGDGFDLLIGDARIVDDGGGD